MNPAARWRNRAKQARFNAMWKFLGKALVGMVLTREAQQVAGGLAKHAVKKALPEIKPPEALPEIEEPVPAQAVALVTTDRAELIRQAMQIRAAKQSLLNDLNDEDRAKLVATAMRAFLNEGKPTG
jgi:hypothetical protein